MRPMAEAPRDETWVVLFWRDGLEPRARAGFWCTGEDADWYESEASSGSLTAFWGEPIGWLPMPQGSVYRA